MSNDYAKWIEVQEARHEGQRFSMMEAKAALDALKPLPTTEKGPVAKAADGAAVLIFFAVLVVLAILYFAAILILSPGILVGMLSVDTMWVSRDAWMLSAVLAAMVFGIIFAMARNLRKAGAIYAGLCVVATISMNVIGFHHTRDFLNGQYIRMSRSSPSSANATSRTAIPSVTITNFSAADGEQPPQPQSASTPAAQVPAEPAPAQTASAESSKAAAGASHATSMTSVSPASTKADATDAPPPSGLVTQADVRPEIASAGRARSEGVLEGQLSTRSATSEPIAPSFDCSKAALFAEVRVCANPELASLDRKLADMYAVVRQRGAVASLERDQKGWLQDRKHCKDDKCLVGSYQMRLYQLMALSKP